MLLLQGKQGEVKHVYRGYIFIHTRNLVENGGMIVARSKEVELAGSTGGSTAVSCVTKTLTELWFMCH